MSEVVNFPVPAVQEPVVRAVAHIDDSRGQWDLVSPSSVDYTTSLDARKGQHVSLMMKARLQKGLPLGDQIGKTIQLTNWLAHHASWSQKDGEIVVGVRIVLIDDHGICYSCGSQGVRQALKLLIQILGPGPWDRPVPATVVTVTTRAGYKMLSLDFDLSGFTLSDSVDVSPKVPKPARKGG